MREWIVTNGLGGYASLTNKNTNNRKYHGLLISSLNPPTQRWVFLSNIYDEINLINKTTNLQDIKPKYSFNYFPNFTYKIDKNTEIKKTICMQHLKNTTILKYEIKTNKPITIKHTPIVNSRHIYDVNSQRYLNFQQETTKNGIVIKPENTDKKIKIMLKDSEYKPNFCWEVFYYDKDHERNDSWIDNNANIGEFTKKITKNTTYYIAVTLEKEINSDFSKIYEKEKQRKQQIIENTKLDPKFKKLILSSDNFIVNKKNSKSIVAGYHWFSDWGRDTLISLPGLTLITKRFKDAKQILKEFGKHSKNGLIPNVFGERDSQPSYNTVDASLWYIDRVYQYLKYTDDISFLKQNWNT